MRIRSLIALLLIFIPISSYADLFYWRGWAGNGLWTDQGNWYNDTWGGVNGTPNDFGDSAVFDTVGGTIAINGAPLTIGELIIGNGLIITINQNVQLTIDNSTLSGNFTLRSRPFNNNAPLIVDGVTNIDIGVNDISFANPNNNFRRDNAPPSATDGVTISSARDVTLTDIGSINFNSVNMTGSLIVTAADVVDDDSAPVVVGGDLHITTSTAFYIDMDQLAVTGTIELDTTNPASDATIVNAGTANLTDSTIAGNLTVTATGAGSDIIDTGPISVTSGTSTAAFTVPVGRDVILVH